MHNVFINGLRKQRPQPLDHAPPELVDPMPSGQQRAMELRDLETSLARLKPDQREVLLLVCLEDMSYEQVAEVLGIPTGTVMSRLHRARQSLRTIMNQGATPALRRVK